MTEMEELVKLAAGAKGRKIRIEDEDGKVATLENTGDSVVLHLGSKAVTRYPVAKGFRAEPHNPTTRETPDECFAKCVAGGDGTLGAEHKCASKCGLT